MTARTQTRAAWIGLVTCLSLAAPLSSCASAPAPVALTDTWPDAPAAYEDAHRAWTRRGVIRIFDQQIAEIFATFKSPAWRASYVDRTAQIQRMSGKAREALQASHAEAARGPYEVEVLMTTYETRENDLDRGERSVWRLTLVDGDGNEVEPVEIKKDRRPRDVLRAEYPDINDFAEAYVIRFPRTIEVLGQGAQKFSVKLASTRGSVELVWRGQ